MSKLLKRLLAASVLVGALFGAALYAADTSTTVNARTSVQPVGSNPLFAVVKATATAAAASAGSMTFDLPKVPGKVTSDILEILRAAYTANGASKPLNIVVSGTVVTVSNSNMTSGTLATGDIVRLLIIYKQ